MSYLIDIKQLSHQLAQSMMHDVISVEHVLLALLKDENSKVVEALQFIHFDSFSDKKLVELTDSLRQHLMNEHSLTATPEEVRETLGFGRVFRRAEQFAEHYGRGFETGVDVLLGVYYEKESYAANALERYGISLEDIQQYLAKTQATKPAKNQSDPSIGIDLQTLMNPGTASQNDDVNDFVENLNEKYRQGRLPPLIGREEEIQATIRVLTQSRKSNPLLVGDAGVGKTTIAAGLAQLIVENKVPMQLRGKQVYSLSLASIMSGTEYRGAFEKRMQAVMDFFQGNSSAILFIDEIHMIVGAGSTSGSQMDMANILKPALASGELSCIGATTYKEFRKHLEKDEALTRRFQKIDVPEPTAEEATEILKGLKKRIEQHHHLNISDEVIKTTVMLAQQYIKERKLPDIAIDVLDEAAALRNMVLTGTGERKLVLSDVEKVIASKAKVSLDKISQASQSENTMQGLAKQLKTNIYGQDHAIDSLVSAIQLAHAGLRDANKPVGSFLFAGPTGVGKTELVKELANELQMNLIRVDMSEYAESHTISKLIGAPPGYVGHDESAGILTEGVNKDPQSIVLLDEIEKAHPQIYNILLQVMDYGTLTDSHGRKIDFKHTIVILTTNAGASALQKRSIGFSDQDNSSDSKIELARVFTPEFRNRLDEIIQFSPLPQAVSADIVKKLVAQLQATLKEKGVTIELDDSAILWLVENGYDAAMGARPMARLVTNHLKKPLAKELLYGQLKEGGKVIVHAASDGLGFDFAGH